MSKNLSLGEIAKALDAKLAGDADFRVTRLAHPADISSANDLALAMDAKLLPLLKDGKAVAAVIDEKSANDADFIKSRIIVARPRLAMARLTALFAEPIAVKPGIHPSAVIEKSAKIGKNAAIGAQVYIGENVIIGENAVIHPQVYIGEAAVIGDDALIYPGVKIGAGCKIGARFIIHFNSSIGSDGFSFVTPQIGSVEAAKTGGGGAVTAQNSALIRIFSLAPVIIGDDVEVGANSSIDRGTIAATRIGNGTKIDNQVQIGHNVWVGENCLICGRVGIAGSAVIGDRVVLGGAVGVADHIIIGDDAIMMAMSGAGGNVPAKSIVSGIPAIPREKAFENMLNMGRLKRFFSKIEDLAGRLDRLEKSGKSD